VANDTDLLPCPVYKKYQLIRNILAACVRTDGNASLEHGQVVLIYDERNLLINQVAMYLQHLNKLGALQRIPTFYENAVGNVLSII